MRFCPQCGKELNGQPKFCPGCGHKLEAVQPAPPTAAPVTPTPVPIPVGVGTGTRPIPAPAGAASGSVLALGIVAIVCIVPLLFAWVSCPIMQLAASLGSSMSGISGLSFKSEYSVPDLFFMLQSLSDQVGSLGAFSGYSSDAESALSGVVIGTALFLILWVGSIVLLAVNAWQCLRNKRPKTVVSGLGFGFAAGLALIAIVVLSLANGFITQMVYQSTGGMSNMISITYIEPTAWVWVSLVVAIVGIVLTVRARKTTANASGGVHA